ncbi:MAG TPA: phospho-N-acetylmuramoyl-pentapeptide-transferase [Bacillota bacterium]|nr:phospho-N-acetylmuramoyl-pentapeptide-transferase [Bacillota bacterium]HQC48766.1 phospho-N-acetylmuramoyl-pentapeptide-transferase [Bacillota bacterium]
MFPVAEMRFAVISLVVIAVGTIVCGLIMLPRIRRIRSSQPIRDNGPQSHLSKAGTPTFGGLFFLIPITLFAIISPVIKRDLLPMTFMVVFMLLFGLVGFADDYIKVNVSRKGLSVRQKTIWLGLFSIAATVFYLWISPYDPFILSPTGKVIPIIGVWKIVYAFVLVPFLFYMSNSVNITDGVDGLLSSLMSIAGVGLFAVSCLLAPVLPYVLSTMTLSLVISGGCLGFLLFNRHPARIFMGDTGSQALGIAFVLLTVVMGVPYLAVITGFVFFFEGFSVVIQVIYFKSTGGKRIFRMSPIHHHFELGGWHEKKIVLMFSLVGVVSSLAGFLLMSYPLFRR